MARPGRELRQGAPPDVQLDSTTAAVRLDALFQHYDPLLLEIERPDTADVPPLGRLGARRAHARRENRPAFSSSIFLSQATGGNVAKRGARGRPRAQRRWVFWCRALLEPRRLLEQTRALQALSDVPLFFAADYERGAGRFSNALTELPSNMVPRGHARHASGRRRRTSDGHREPGRRRQPAFRTRRRRQQQSAQPDHPTSTLVRRRPGACRGGWQRRLCARPRRTAF